MRALPALALVALAVLAPPAPAVAQDAPDPSFHVLAQRLYLKSQQRGLDQLGNPELLARVAPYARDGAPGQRHAAEPHRPYEVDPFRLDWGRTRGRELDVSIRNRYGARLHGHLSAPRERRDRVRPAVVLLTGGRGGEHGYRGLQQGLAEAGYVVLGVSAHGDNGSEQPPDDPDPMTPQHEGCRDEPGPPQEMGLREPSSCPGMPGPGEGFDELLVRVAGHNEPDDTLQEGYLAHAPRKTFAALDAVRWLLSDDNPLRSEVDAAQVGVVGHSFGSIGALLAGNGDPRRRFATAVVLDGHGRLAPFARPTVPTLWLMAELNDFGPYREPPDRDDTPGHAHADDFRAAGVPTATIVLQGTHQEFNYVPPPAQQAPIAFNATRDGERVALHYLLAWLDRFLVPGARSRADAEARLTTQVFDDRADRSSVGQGPYDPVAGRTVPPSIAGEGVAEHVSPLYRSFLDVPGLRCADLSAGCG